MQPSKKFAFDVGITFFASVVSLPLGFVITVALGRYLGAGDLGLYRMATMIYGIAMLFAAIGIPAAMIKYVAEFKNDRTKFNQIVSSGVITSLFLGIGFIALFYFSSGLFAEIFNMPGLSGLLKLLSPVFPFALVGGALLGLLNGLREMKKYAVATIIQSVLMVIVTVALIYYGFGVAGAVIGVVLSSVGNCLFLIFVSRKYFEITLSEYVQTTKKMLRFSVQLLTAGAINEINNQLDIILVGFFLLSADVGYYAIAIGLSRFFWMIPLSIQKITYPATSSYWSENNHVALNTMLNKTMKYCTVILVLIGLGVGFFARDIITLLFKENFVYAVLPLQILLIGTVIRGSIAQPIGGSLAGIGRPDLALKISALMMAINATLDIILIPQIGIVGAAIATTISLAGGAFINLGLIIKHLSIKVDIRWYLGILGVALIAIVLFKFGIVFVNPFLLGGIILIGYAILIFRFFLTEEDKVMFKSLSYSLIPWR
jgi:O-antigen/teichoic acid export membrane protein